MPSTGLGSAFVTTRSEIDFVPDPVLYPFESHFFDSSGGTLHYVDEGPRDAPTILMCHGNPMWSFLYRHLITGLRDRFRCVAADMIGFGLSGRPQGYGYTYPEHVTTIGDLVDHLGLDGYVSMGQDWGGPVSLGVAVRRAERVRGMVLGNTWFWPSTPSFKAFSLAMSTGPMQRRILEDNFFVETLMPKFGHGNYSALEWKHYTEVQPTPNARRGVAQFPRQIRAADPHLAELERDVKAKLGGKPTLVVWGLRDRGFRKGPTVARIQRAFADCEVVELPKAGHYFQEEAPDEVIAAITKRFG